MRSALYRKAGHSLGHSWSIEAYMEYAKVDEKAANNVMMFSAAIIPDDDKQKIANILAILDEAATSIIELDIKEATAKQIKLVRDLLKGYDFDEVSGFYEQSKLCFVRR